MDETTAVNALLWYESLEAQVVDFIKIVPLHTQNESTWSHALATVLVEACNLLESVLYQITPEPAPLPKPTARKKLQLEDYMALCRTPLGLPERKVILFQFLQEWRVPFRDSRPEWWDIHNRSKHRRLDHVHDFTVKHTLDALAGALVVITTAPFLRPAHALASAMVRLGWIETPASELLGLVPKFYEENPPNPHLWPCPETALFAVPIGRDSLLPDTIQKLPQAFSGVSGLCAGKKLRRLLSLGY